MTSTREAENQQAKANVLWLAELEVACPCKCHDLNNPRWSWECEAEEKERCRTCGGQGTGARYPQLREKCGCYCHNLSRLRDSSECFERCNLCQGRSYLPVSHEKAATEGRKLPEFQRYIYSECCYMRLSVKQLLETLCDDNLTIAALTKMEEAKHAN